MSSRKRKHIAKAKAEANERVANDLHSSGNWDWCVTVAFYSALWYADCRVFPFEHKRPGSDPVMIHSLAERCVVIGGKASHDTREQVIRKRLASIHPDYRDLYERSRTARYWDTAVAEGDADDALALLALIKAVCLEPRPATKSKRSKK